MNANHRDVELKSNQLLLRGRSLGRRGVGGEEHGECFVGEEIMFLPDWGDGVQPRHLLTLHS